LKTQRTERHELDAMASPSDGEDEGAETPADQADHRAQCVCGIEVELVVLYKTKQRIHSTRRSPPLRAYLARAASKYQYLRKPVSSAPPPTASCACDASSGRCGLFAVTFPPRRQGRSLRKDRRGTGSRALRSAPASICRPVAQCDRCAEPSA